MLYPAELPARIGSPGGLGARRIGTTAGEPAVNLGRRLDTGRGRGASGDSRSGASRLAA